MALSRETTGMASITRGPMCAIHNATYSALRTARYRTCCRQCLSSWPPCSASAAGPRAVAASVINSSSSDERCRGLDTEPWTCATCLWQLTRSLDRPPTAHQQLHSTQRPAPLFDAVAQRNSSRPRQARYQSFHHPRAWDGSHTQSPPHSPRSSLTPARSPPAIRAPVPPPP